MKSSHLVFMLNTLSKRYPVVKTQLEHKNAFELLIATILSAQCTDRQVNSVTRGLFARFPTPTKLARAPLEEIRTLIFSTGFYKNKANHIKNCARALVENHGGEVPRDMESLVSLPGVGRKTANVVRSVCFGAQAIVVDTHVHRVSQRLGLTHAKDAVKAEFELMDMIPRSSWNDFSLQLIYFGREICDARKPCCTRCPLIGICVFGK